MDNVNDPEINPWFGTAPWGRVCVEAPQVPAPVGTPCLYCAEPIAADDCGMVMSGSPIHQECLLRMVAGSVAHQEGRCHCYGGKGEDDPALTRRQAARAAADVFESHLRRTS